MSLSRRKFLQVGAVAAVSAGTSMSVTNALASSGAKTGKGATSPSSAKPASSNSRHQMSKAQFAALLNTTFFIRSTGSHELPVQLVELEDRVPKALKSAVSTSGKECFALAFCGPAKNLQQDTYRIRHASLGEFDLFIGVVNNKKHGQIYEAIINHLDV